MITITKKNILAFCKAEFRSKAMIEKHFNIREADTRHLARLNTLLYNLIRKRHIVKNDEERFLTVI